MNGQQQQQSQGRPPSGMMAHASPSLAARQTQQGNPNEQQQQGPGGGQQQGPGSTVGIVPGMGVGSGMMARTSQENSINHEVMQIPQILFNSLMQELGFGDKAFESLNMNEKHQILGLWRLRQQQGKVGPGPSQQQQPPGQPSAGQMHALMMTRSMNGGGGGGPPGSGPGHGGPGSHQQQGEQGQGQGHQLMNMGMHPGGPADMTMLQQQMNALQIQKPGMPPGGGGGGPPSQQQQQGIDTTGLFRPDGDINFERDFGQWFNPVAGGMDDFDTTALFRQDGDINFERDFGHWFNPDDVNPGPWVSPGLKPDRQDRDINFERDFGQWFK